MDEDDQLSFLEGATLKADKVIVTSSYELALTNLARLVAYGISGAYAGVSGEVAIRQTQLATDDILHLSISLRRLITATGIHSKAKNISVPRVRFRQTDLYGFTTYIDGTYDLWSLIGKAIHSVEIELLSDSTQLLRGRLGFWESYQLRRNKDQYRFPPVCFLKTESGQEVMFHLAALCEAADEAIEAATDHATNFGIYLGSFYND